MNAPENPMKSRALHPCIIGVWAENGVSGFMATYFTRRGAVRLELALDFCRGTLLNENNALVGRAYLRPGCGHAPLALI